MRGQPRKGLGIDQHSKRNRLFVGVLGEIHGARSAIRLRVRGARAEERSRVHTPQVQAVEVPEGRRLGVALRIPDVKMGVEHNVDLEVQLGPVAGNAFARVGGMPERGDHLALAHKLAHHQTLRHFAQVGVKREHLNAVPAMAKHYVAAIVREAGLGVDERDFAIGHRVNRIGGFPATVGCRHLMSMPSCKRWP